MVARSAATLTVRSRLRRLLLFTLAVRIGSMAVSAGVPPKLVSRALRVAAAVVRPEYRVGPCSRWRPLGRLHVRVFEDGTIEPVVRR